MLGARSASHGSPVPQPFRDPAPAAGTWSVLTPGRTPSGPTTRFALPFCLLPSRFPSPKKVGVQRVRSPWRLRGAELSAVEWEGGSRRARSGSLSRRFPGGGAPRCELPGPRVEQGPGLRRPEGVWRKMGARMKKGLGGAEAERTIRDKERDFSSIETPAVYRRDGRLGMAALWSKKEESERVHRDHLRSKESGRQKSKGVSSEMQMEPGRKGSLGCEVATLEVPSPKSSWSLAAGFGLGGWRPYLPQGGGRGVLPQSRRPRRGKGYVVGFGVGSPKSPGCLPFLHPRCPRGSARSRSLSPAVPASVLRSTRSWCRGGTWREATS